MRHSLSTVPGRPVGGRGREVVRPPKLGRTTPALSPQELRRSFCGGFVGKKSSLFGSVTGCGGDPFSESRIVKLNARKLVL